MGKKSSKNITSALTDICGNLFSDSKKKAFFAALPWICLGGTYLAAVLFQIIYGEQLLNSDMSAEIILADLLNKSGSFVISKDWYYSTELRVLNQQLTLQLGLLLFPHNWHLARTFSQAVLLAAHAVCFLFLAHECGLKRTGVYCTAILMCPFGFWYMWYGTWGTFYLPHMMLISLDMALMLHVSRGKRHRLVCFLFLFLLSFVEGLGGVRMLMNFYIPMIVAALVVVFLQVQKEPLQKPFHKSPALRLTSVGVPSALAAVTGYLINTAVLSQSYTFTTYENQYWRQFEIGNLIDVLSDFLRLFGYPYVENLSYGPWSENNLFSTCGILGAFGLVLMCAVIFSALRLLIRWKELSFTHLAVTLTFWACLGIDSLVYACLEDTANINGSYWLPIVPLAIALLAIEIKTEHFRVHALRCAIVTILFFCTLCSSASTAVRVLYTKPRVSNGLDQVGEWLVENGWTDGYAIFWNGDALAELTDGEVEIWIVTSIADLNISPWLQSKSHDTAPEGKVFVLLQSGDNPPYYSEENVIYTDENNWVVLGYDSAEQLYALMAEATAGSN